MHGVLNQSVISLTQAKKTNLSIDWISPNF